MPITVSKTVDHFTLPYSSRETAFDASPDGKTMYMNPMGYIIEIDLDSLTDIAEHPMASTLSPPGPMAAVGYQISI